MHRHRPRPEAHKITGWTRCVAPHSGCDGRAHGGVILIDECRCGAARRTESTGGTRRRSSGWVVEGGQR